MLLNGQIKGTSLLLTIIFSSRSFCFVCNDGVKNKVCCLSSGTINGVAVCSMMHTDIDAPKMFNICVLRGAIPGTSDMTVARTAACDTLS
jgi:hypothetical protein